ncbi:MAG: hypothetical protein WAO58_01975 [Fimbriimonadaceae bacterium]
MITLLAATAMLGAGQSVADYFPLTQGMSWQYASDGMISRDRVAPVEDVGGSPAIPVISEVQGKESHRTYYRVVDDTVLIVAYEAKKPLAEPVPILKFGKGRSTWEFTGQTMFINEPAPMTMKGEASLKGKRKVLDQEVEVIEVKLSGMIGSNPGTAVRSNQVAYYAKGIGLVEMLSENSVGATKSKSQLKLVKFEPPK